MRVVVSGGRYDCSLVLPLTTNGDKRVVVLHHTDCGLKPSIIRIFKSNTVNWELMYLGSDFLPFRDIDESVRDEVVMRMSINSDDVIISSCLRW